MKIDYSLNKVFNSPTLMTWLSYVASSGTLLFVLPFILKNFSVEEVALWYLFALVIQLGNMADFGFRVTFIRFIAMALGGATDVNQMRKIEKDEFTERPINWVLLENIYSMMSRIYIYLTIIILLLMSTLGSLIIYKPISYLESQDEGWIAWIFVCIGAAANFYAKMYGNYIEGMNKVALVKRNDAIVKFISIIASIIVLIVNPTLMNLAIVVNVFMVINILIKKRLAKKIYEGRLEEFKKRSFDKVMFSKIWNPAWRSGISGLMSNGLTSLTGVFYSQVGNIESVAAYLLSLKLITEIRNVSNAPFYSKIPKMVKLRSQHDIKKLINVAKRGMFLTHSVFGFGVVFLAFFSETLLDFIGSETKFVESEFWILLSIAFMIHRYGALHMQNYLTTNHVISHIADTISGIIFISSTFILLPVLGLYAFPISMIIGYLGFHAWYSAYHSYKSLNVSFIEFEKKNLIAIGCTLLFLGLSIVLI